MSDCMVRKWVQMFNEGRENMHDEARIMRPCLMNDDLVRKINEWVREERICQFLLCPCTCLSFQELYCMTS